MDSQVLVAKISE